MDAFYRHCFIRRVLRVGKFGLATELPQEWAAEYGF